ncbi:MAG: ABC transporter permease [Bdellovibrionales bacterium]|nr:ABC transporter permease [Bdellovibrionales bacterium]
MKKQELVWSPFLTLFSREIRRFSKVLAQTIFIPVVNSFIYLLIFGVSLGKNIQVLEGLSYLEFLIPGLIMMGCMNNSYQNGSSSLLSMKFGGEIVDIKTSPLSVQQIVWAMSLGGLFRGLVVGLVVFISGEMFHYFYEHTWLIPAHPFYFLFFCVIGGLAFTKLGIAVAFWAKTFDHISAIGGFIILPLIYLGGVFFSLDNLHSFWVKVSYFNPLLYFINGVRYGVLGVSDVSINTAFWVSLLGLFLFHLIAIWTLKKGSYQPW